MWRTSKCAERARATARAVSSTGWSASLPPTGTKIVFIAYAAAIQEPLRIEAVGVKSLALPA